MPRSLLPPLSFLSRAGFEILRLGAAPNETVMIALGPATRPDDVWPFQVRPSSPGAIAPVFAPVSSVVSSVFAAVVTSAHTVSDDTGGPYDSGGTSDRAPMTPRRG